jgi:hypothetical protein
VCYIHVYMMKRTSWWGWVTLPATENQIWRSGERIGRKQVVEGYWQHGRNWNSGSRWVHHEKAHKEKKVERPGPQGIATFRKQKQNNKSAKLDCVQVLESQVTGGLQQEVISKVEYDRERWRWRTDTGNVGGFQGCNSVE